MKTINQSTDLPTLTDRLQQKCSEWGTYWRASDSHGVVLSQAQALELLRDALGVEVEFSEDLAAQGAPLCPVSHHPQQGGR
jgi:hypothetical protein